MNALKEEKWLKWLCYPERNTFLYTTGICTWFSQLSKTSKWEMWTIATDSWWFSSVKLFCKHFCWQCSWPCLSSSSLRFTSFFSFLTRFFSQERTTWRCASWAWRRRASRGSGVPRSSPGSSRRSGNAAAGSSTSAAPSRAGRRGPPTPQPCCRACSSDGARRRGFALQTKGRMHQLPDTDGVRARCTGSDSRAFDVNGVLFFSTVLLFFLRLMSFRSHWLLVPQWGQGGEVLHWTLCRNEKSC